MGSGFSKMKKQARLMQGQFELMREQQASQIVEGSAGSGLVSVQLNGEKKLIQIVIKPECVNPNDVEGLQDLILAAYADAASKLQEPASPFG